jgi:hypothetical protein
VSYNTKYKKRGFNCGACLLEFWGKGLESGIPKKFILYKLKQETL